MALAAIAGAFVLIGCTKSIPRSNAAICADVAGVRQLIADAEGGLPQAAQLLRIQSLETSLTGEAMFGGVNGDAAAGTEAANLAVALGNWKTDISLDEDGAADRARAAAAADRVTGCEGG